jgi:hypothetical protein
MDAHQTIVSILRFGKQFSQKDIFTNDRLMSEKFQMKLLGHG